VLYSGNSGCKPAYFYRHGSATLTPRQWVFPDGLAFDPCGNLYITVKQDFRIRKVIFDTLHNYISLMENNLNSSTKFFFSPNPATNKLTIQISNTLSQITISNMMGQVVYEDEYHTAKAEVNISDLPPGMYMLAVVDDEGNKTVRKIVKE
jgi:hypothetical protein